MLYVSCVLRLNRNGYSELLPVFEAAALYLPISNNQCVRFHIVKADIRTVRNGNTS